MTTGRTRCDGCPLRDGQQRCALLLDGRMRQLFANDDCAIHQRLPQLVASYFTRHFTRHASYAEDISQDVVRELIEASEETYRFARLEDLLGWIPRHLQRRTLDALRKTREVARPRCGACAHFSRTEGCRLDPSREVTASTNPQRLPEPCYRSAWIRMIVAWPEEREFAASGEPVAEESDQDLLEHALHALEERDAKGRKAVTAIRMHSLGGLTMLQAGQRLGVSHMSIKRAVDYGIRELRGILARMRGEHRSSTSSALFPSLHA